MFQIIMFSVSVTAKCGTPLLNSYGVKSPWDLLKLGSQKARDS